MRKQLKQAKGARSDLKRRFLFIFLMKNVLFYEFNNSFNRTAKIFIQRIYSFKKDPKLFIQRIYSFIKIKNHSFKENIHSCKKWITAQGYWCINKNWTLVHQQERRTQPMLGSINLEIFGGQSMIKRNGFSFRKIRNSEKWLFVVCANYYYSSSPASTSGFQQIFANIFPTSTMICF